MELPKLTAEQRIKLYWSAMADIRLEKQQFVCHALLLRISEIYSISTEHLFDGHNATDERIKIFFPEFYAQKPKGATLAWFDNKSERVDALSRAIELAKKSVDKNGKEEIDLSWVPKYTAKQRAVKYADAIHMIRDGSKYACFILKNFDPYEYWIADNKYKKIFIDSMSTETYIKYTFPEFYAQKPENLEINISITGWFKDSNDEIEALKRAIKLALTKDKSEAPWYVKALRRFIQLLNTEI